MRSELCKKNQQELYKQITRQIFEQAWSKANFDGLDELIDSHARFHIRNQTVPMGAQETRRVISSWHRVFPDFRFSIEALVAESDFVAVRLILSGTHNGMWKDIPATGKHIRVTAMMFLHFENGKLVEIWEDFDELGMHQQLSVVKPPYLGVYERAGIRAQNQWLKSPLLSSKFGPIDEFAGSAFKDWRPAQESPPVETDGWYSKPAGSGLKNAVPGSRSPLLADLQHPHFWAGRPSHP